LAAHRILDRWDGKLKLQGLRYGQADKKITKEKKKEKKKGKMTDARQATAMFGFTLHP
jgi:hypothetical protein